MEKEVFIALGYFDSVHLGHRQVIKECIKKAGDKYLPVIFTFNGNLKKAIGVLDGKSVFLPKERKELLHSLGAKKIFFAPVNKHFLGKSKEEFLTYLNKKYKIKGYVSGLDYRFGKNGEGDIAYLKEYAQKSGQTVRTVDTLFMDNKKVSTTEIKELLSEGSIEKANLLLGQEYFFIGKVFRDRKVGRKLGYPTINIKTDKDRFLIKEGVYSGYVFIDDKKYKAVINYGSRPTFDLDRKLIETHIIGFNGNLYGKKIKIYFEKYIREIKKFNSLTELKKQIEKDIRMAKEND